MSCLTLPRTSWLPHAAQPITLANTRACPLLDPLFGRRLVQPLQCGHELPRAVLALLRVERRGVDGGLRDAVLPERRFVDPAQREAGVSAAYSEDGAAQHFPARRAAREAGVSAAPSALGLVYFEPLRPEPLAESPLRLSAGLTLVQVERRELAGFERDEAGRLYWEGGGNKTTGDRKKMM